MAQLPGIFPQRLMVDGFGFAYATGTAALVRAMAQSGHSRGNSFMEDYTYHFGNLRTKWYGTAYAGDLFINS